MFWRIFVFFPMFMLLGLGLFSLGMDADSDQLMISIDSAPNTLDLEVSTNLCCFPGEPPPYCRATGPNNPLPTSLHRRAQVR